MSGHDKHKERLKNDSEYRERFNQSQRERYAKRKELEGYEKKKVETKVQKYIRETKPRDIKMFSERCEKCFYRADNICAVVEPAVVFSELKKCNRRLGFAQKNNFNPITSTLNANGFERNRMFYDNETA